MKEVIIGIDPGKTGGISVIFNGSIMEYHKTPLISDKVIDIHMFANIINDIKQLCNLNGYKLIMFIETVHAIYGASAKSTFEFGYVSSVPVTIAATLGISYVMVDPKTWQKPCWQGIPIQKKMEKGKQKTNTKAMSLLAAKRLFPDEKFLGTERSRVPHDGIVDATLIAYFGFKFYQEI